MGKRLRAVFAVCLAAVCMTLALTGCTSNETYEPAGKDPVVSSPTIGEDGVLRVGVNTSNPPLAGKNSSDKIIGIDVDIAAAIADELGLKVSIVDVGTDPESALAEGKVDIVLGVDEADDEGAFWLSSEYLPTGIALFSLSETAGIPAAGDGSTFAAQISSKSAWAVTNEFGEDSLTSTTTLAEAFNKLQAGEVDYVASDAVVGSYAARTEGIDVHIAAMLLAPSGYCAGVASDNADLQKLIDDVLKDLVDSGIINVIELKWLSMSIDLSEIGLTAGVPLETEEGEEASGEEGEAANGEATTTSQAAAANRP